MQIREAIVLAGGLGTRLREAVPDLPKCMAPVNGKPFLHYLLVYFQQQGIERFILSVGYKHELVSDYFAKTSHDFNLMYVVENEPLGTGGGIQLTLPQVIGKNVLVLNGDTFFKIDLNAFSTFHNTVSAECSLALKPMKQFDRYGVVESGPDHKIISFKEKRPYERGSINGGVYAIDKERFLDRRLPVKFSIEKDYFEEVVDEGCLFGQEQDRYFIDIGIPTDYSRVQRDFLAFNEL
jgi:D-glycero-alpha-D-manno-heptose 1-phosphate guanylyltransferase